MSPVQVFRFALAGLAANKLRSALTTLGILIGVGSVILLVAVGNGSSQAVQNADLLPGRERDHGAAHRGLGRPARRRRAARRSRSRRTSPRQTRRPWPRPQGVASVSPVVSTSETLSNGASSTTASLTGTYPSYFPAEDDTVSHGRAISPRRK